MNLKAQRDAAMKAATDIVAASKSAQRDLTDAEVNTIDAQMDVIRDLDEKLKKAAASKAILERVAQSGMTITGGDGTGDFPDMDSSSTMSLFGLKDAGPRIARQLMTAHGPGGAKAVPTSVAQTVPIVVDAEPVAEGSRQPTVFDLLPVRQVFTPAWTYRRAVSRELNAATVGEGEVKPTSNLQFQDITGHLGVIATIAGPLAEATLIDYPAMVSFIEGELMAGVRLAVEDQVFSGTGEDIMATGEPTRKVGQYIQGILNTTGVLQQAAGTDVLATIAIAATRLEADGYQLSGIAMNPTDWVNIATKRNTSGGYDLGGAVDAATRKIWGHDVRLTRGVPLGKALAISKEAAAIRTGSEGITIRAIAINDDMARNQVRVRVEGRFALDVYRPSGMCVIDLDEA